FDAVFSDPLLLPQSPVHLLIVQSPRRHSAHAQFGMFFSRESACDQHSANQHCPDRGQGFCILLVQSENSSYKL
ncbi:unnamed protein product, partial [Staurois parvus]